MFRGKLLVVLMTPMISFHPKTSYFIHVLKEKVFGMTQYSVLKQLMGGMFGANVIMGYETRRSQERFASLYLTMVLPVMSFGRLSVPLRI